MASSLILYFSRISVEISGLRMPSRNRDLERVGPIGVVGKGLAWNKHKDAKAKRLAEADDKLLYREVNLGDQAEHFEQGR